MKLEQIILTISGIAILAALFLPFIALPASMTGEEQSLQLTGLGFVQTLLDQFDLTSYDDGEALMGMVSEKWEQAEDFRGLGLVIGLLLVLAGPVWFGLHALGYILRGLRGKQYGRGIFFAILFLVFSWLVFWLWGNATGIALNFFNQALMGFWIGFGGMILAAFSLFFEKK